MNATVRQVLAAVAAGKVTGEHRALAVRELRPAPEKQPVPSVKHHAKVRRAEEREREETSEETWQSCVERTVRDYGTTACEVGDHLERLDRLEPHHLQYGSGHRQEEERPENVMTSCRTCHDKFHARPVRFVERVKAWCTAHLFPLPNRKEYR